MTSCRTSSDRLLDFEPAHTRHVPQCCAQNAAFEWASSRVPRAHQPGPYLGSAILHLPINLYVRIRFTFSPP